VTTLKDFPTSIPLSTLLAMTFELKKTCACGGTLKGRIVELQGDVCDRVCEELKLKGYQAVRAGG
jgi:translation initiation factor 1 (eIF-1/SUI1)